MTVVWGGLGVLERSRQALPQLLSLTSVSVFLLKPHQPPSSARPEPYPKKRIPVFLWANFPSKPGEMCSACQFTFNSSREKAWADAMQLAGGNSAEAEVGLHQRSSARQPNAT